nr:YheC/YheD family protein [Tumebacillus amylolyticus]
MPLADELGVSLYVFTPGDARWKEGWVNASIYNRQTKQWQKVKRPLPDLVLPKILGTPPAWREEVLHDTKQFHHLVTHGTFNDATGNKWTVHQQLEKNPAVTRWLPETHRITQPGDVEAMLLRHGSVYIKPAFGTQGMMIYKLDLLKSEDPAQAKSTPSQTTARSVERPPAGNHVLVQHRSKSKSLHRRFHFASPALRTFLKKHFLAKRTFLVQQTLPLLTLRGGRPVDFRWLMQKDGTDTWRVTARVARVGAANRLTTNLHTGGAAVLAETLLQKNGWPDLKSRRRLLQDLDDAALAICQTLETNTGRIGELGLDFGISKLGEVYLIEVNPRPGRQMLLDTSPDLRRLSLLRNLEYAKSTTGYQP